MHERPCKPSSSVLLPQWHVRATQMLPRDANQLKSGAADNQVSGPGSCKEPTNNVESLRPELDLMSVKKFRTFVIHSKNQILGSFDVDRLFPIFLSSIERTFLFIRQTQPFLKRFCKRNIFKCFRENRREKVTCTKS